MNISMGKMGADMATDCRRITVHTVRFLNKKGSVFYASLPLAGESLKECGANGEDDRHRLVTLLWDHLVAMENPLWKFYYTSSNEALPVRVICSGLGKPYLLLGEYQGPAISFSEGGGKVWAALCGDGPEIGIDMAGTYEFKGEYPYHRVFHEQELRHALSLTLGDAEQASALLWSVKEAVVKAIGCAFHMVEPRQVHVYPSVNREGMYTFPVRLSGDAIEQLPTGADRCIWVDSLPQMEGWFSIAHLDRNVHATRPGTSQLICCNNKRLFIREGKEYVPDAFNEGV
jgi:phosphopantetheinyl transferase (holo-ACP synthase)